MSNRSKRQSKKTTNASVQPQVNSEDRYILSINKGFEAEIEERLSKIDPERQPVVKEVVTLMSLLSAVLSHAQVELNQSNLFDWDEKRAQRLSTLKWKIRQVFRRVIGCLAALNEEGARQALEMRFNQLMKYLDDEGTYGLISIKNQQDRSSSEPRNLRELALDINTILEQLILKWGARNPTKRKIKKSGSRKKHKRQARLTDKQKEAIKVYEHVRTYEAAGVELGITRQAAKDRVERGKKNLAAINHSVDADCRGKGTSVRASQKLPKDYRGQVIATDDDCT